MLFNYLFYIFFIVITGLKLLYFGYDLEIKYTSLPFLSVTIGSILIFSFWLVFLRTKAWKLCMLILSFTISMLLLSDALYFRYFHDFITFSVLRQAFQVDSLTGSIFSLLKWMDLLFFVDQPIMLLNVFMRMPKKIAVEKRIIAASLTLLLGICLTVPPIHRYIEKAGTNLFLNNWWNESIYNVVGLLGFHSYDLYKGVKNSWLHKQITDQELEEVKAWFAKGENRKEALVPFGVAKGKNLMVVQLEAFESFFINKQINGQAITPNLNSLIKEGIYVENFYWQTAQGRTSDAEFLANASLFPIANGSVYQLYYQNAFDSLPKILKAKGYHTFALHAYEKSFWNRNLMYHHYPFDRFYSMEDFNENETVGWALSDKELFLQGIDKIKGTQPFYSFIVGLSSHHPYTIQNSYKTLKLEAGIEIENNYLQAIHYVDTAIGELINKLKVEKLWDNTVLVLYGDHDAGIKFSDEFYERLGIESLLKSELHKKVPLYIHVPNINPLVIEGVAGQIDITPTILHLLGMGDNGYYVMGDNIFTMKDKWVVLRNGSAISNDYYYEAAGTGVFADGVCYRRKTKELTKVTDCQEGFKESMQALQVSDLIIEHNLIEKMTK
ncbi:LTA synthase family protein [Caldibacillus lycopersici]|uniref:LTA synthase family protein n=1 Tax=Perspicuibacillus lycopersici TaxID=1325689 RepID=A0AAE3LP25_9BACI|nr:LTA synthase family protein [Perspicuibacillus lycopersici]MCU9614546.1 LTA synthase family protein [Perspicuibacillus lycopersici]